MILSRRNLIKRLGSSGLMAPAMAALSAGPAFADQAFTSFAFNATGGSTPRTMPNRIADIVNVLEYGADPSGSADSSSAIQSALDAAFGSSGSPNGFTNAHLNRPVFIPNGKYKINNSLILTQVYGGCIYGAGPGATELNSATGANIFTINGAIGLLMERLLLQAITSIAVVDLDWTNSGAGAGTGAGLHNNLFRDMLITNNSVGTGVRIANSGNEGYGNLFEGIQFKQLIRGIDTASVTAVNNVSYGGGCQGLENTSGVGYYSRFGTIHVLECSIGNNWDTVNPTNAYAIQVDSGMPVLTEGYRWESVNASHGLFMKITNGTVIAKAVLQEAGVQWATMTGGRLIMDGCACDVGAGSVADIVGTEVTAASCTITGTTLSIGGSVTGGSVSKGQILIGAGIPTGSGAPIIASGSGTTWTLNYAPGNVGPITITLGPYLYLRGCSGMTTSSFPLGRINSS